MGATSLRRSTIADASQLPLTRMEKRYCASLSGAIPCGTMPLPFIQRNTVQTYRPGVVHVPAARPASSHQHSGYDRAPPPPAVGGNPTGFLAAGRTTATALNSARDN